MNCLKQCDNCDVVIKNRLKSSKKHLAVKKPYKWIVLKEDIYVQTKLKSKIYVPSQDISLDGWFNVATGIPVVKLCIWPLHYMYFNSVK